MATQEFVLKGPTVALPRLEKSFGAYLFQRVLSHGDKIIQVDGPTGERVPARLVAARAVAAAGRLRAWGVRPGDVVSVAVDNAPPVASLALGVLAAGAVYAPFNPDLQGEDLQHIVRLLEPKVLVVAPRAAAAARGAAGAGARVVEYAPNTDAGGLLRAASEEEVAAFAPEGDSAPGGSAPAPEEVPAVIMSSSGTTGAPKGVVLSQHALHCLIAIFGIFEAQVPAEVRAKDVVIQVMQNFWLTGLMTTLLNMHNGTTLVVFPKFEVDTILGAVQSHKGTFLSLAPNQVAAIAKHPDVERYDVSSLRMLTCSGAVLSVAIRDIAERRLKKKMMLFYGQTECLLAIMPGPKSLAKPASSGTVAINSEIKVINPETGKAVGPNVEGEMCLKSGMKFLGYYKNPEATKDTLDEEGWVHTGDVAYYDEDGYLFIYDRYKELIKYRGTHVPPADIENVLLRYDGVKDAAVVGIESEVDQEHPVGFVVQQPGSALDTQELIRWTNEQLPVYKHLHGGLHIIDEIPRTSTGKIRRRDLRELARKLEK